MPTLILAVVTVMQAVGAASSIAGEPVVSVWYRGVPAGTPPAEDLRAHRDARFEAVTWPAEHSARIRELSAMAEHLGLIVVLEPDLPSFNIDGRVTIRLADRSPNRLPASIWRAVARGARIVSLDPGQDPGAGVRTAAGDFSGWVPVAAMVSRQLSANALLFGALKPAASPRVVWNRSPALDATLLQSARAWVLFVTNDGDRAVAAELQLPAGVPYAIWVSLIDASTIGMRDRPDGARWNLALEPGQAVAYVIDKTLK